jgi:hypothetical protein
VTLYFRIVQIWLIKSPRPLKNLIINPINFIAIATLFFSLTAKSKCAKYHCYGNRNYKRWRSVIMVLFLFNWSSVLYLHWYWFTQCVAQGIETWRNNALAVPDITIEPKQKFLFSQSNWLCDHQYGVAQILLIDNDPINCLIYKEVNETKCNPKWNSN